MTYMLSQLLNASQGMALHTPNPMSRANRLHLVDMISGLLEKDEDLDVLLVTFPDISPLEIHFIVSYENVNSV